VFNPLIPEQWKSYSFKVWFRENVLKINVNGKAITITNEEGPSITVRVLGKEQIIASDASEQIAK
jgi:maltose phosphorylase